MMQNLVLRGIEQYNKYRYPEAEARLVGINNDVIVVEFRGPFRYTCGVVDWIEDLKYELEDLGLRVTLIKIEQRDNSLIGYFKIEK